MKNKLRNLFTAFAAFFFAISLSAQQSGGTGGAGGNGGNAQVAPVKPATGGGAGSGGDGGASATVPVATPATTAPSFPRIILDRLEVAVVKADIGTETWITLYGAFPEAPTGVTISQGGEWVSFSQSWSVENGIKFLVDSSLPPGTYQVSIAQGVESNKQPLSFSVTETGEVVSVPTVGGKTLPLPNNDLRPIIDSFDPKLVAGRRSLITGRRLNPPLMVRIEGNSGDVAWARRIVPTSEGIVEFVTPSTHFGSLVLVVDNGRGTYRVSVNVVPPPSTRPVVTKIIFDILEDGRTMGYVYHNKPLTPTTIIVLGEREKYYMGEDAREIKDIMVLFPPFPPDPEWEAGIARAEAKGLKILRPYTLYGGLATVFIVPEPFASKGLDWLNAREPVDEEGIQRSVNLAVDVEQH